MHLYGRYVPRKPYDHEEKGCFVTWIINGLTPTLFPALIVVSFTIPLHRRFPLLLQRSDRYLFREPFDESTRGFEGAVFLRLSLFPILRKLVIEAPS